MLAAAVRVDRAVGRNVGRIVAGDDAARILPDDFGRRSDAFSQPVCERLPAIVESQPRVALEAVRHPGGGAAAFDGLDRNLGVAQALSS